MQGYSEHNDERTYAAQIAEQQSRSTDGQQHVIVDEKSDERMMQIYNYITQVAERTHDARVTKVNEENQLVKATR